MFRHILALLDSSLRAERAIKELTPAMVKVVFDGMRQTFFSVPTFP